MKSALIITGLALITIVSSCSKSTYPSKEITIPLKQCRSIYADKNIQLCYDSTVTDSRCPADAVCVWAGIGVAKFTWRAGAENHTLTLATYDFVSYRKDTTINNYYFELMDLSPYPGKPSTGLQTATVKVIKK